MPADLLARIAKALEDGPKCDFSGLPQGRCSHCGGDGTMSDGTRSLLGECHAALKIAVEALQHYADPDRWICHYDGCAAFRGDEGMAARALSRIASAAEVDDPDPCEHLGPFGRRFYGQGK